MIVSHGTALRIRRLFFTVGVAVLSLYLVLLIPFSEKRPPKGAAEKPFAWNQDERWETLESRFRAVRNQGCEGLSELIDQKLGRWKELTALISLQFLEPKDPVFLEVERTVFETGPMIGACPQKLPEYISLAAHFRSVLKNQSTHWEMNTIDVRQTLYRLLYGSRAALEEIMLQAQRETVPPLTLGDQEPSQTPSTKILGVTLHSGDILVSRGGAPTSALIARGNDYPGNFSHVGLAFVDEKTSLAAIIESHIERGVTVSTPEEYINDVKLRVMVLRMRSDLPAMKADPLLPHRAARMALENARAHHIPYDFAMNVHDTTRLFCSEVASVPYRNLGINLWMGLSSISTPGIVSWLSAFGVEHFETQEPSDLEYDPQLRVVAEWRDPETLFNDHVDNAVVDAFLEGAEKGEKLSYSWYMLPLGRVMKMYSVVLNLAGREGPIPEGMSAEAALRNVWLSSRHSSVKRGVLKRAEEFKIREGYVPPYWELVKLARQTKNELYPEQTAALTNL